MTSSKLALGLAWLVTLLIAPGFFDGTGLLSSPLGSSSLQRSPISPTMPDDDEPVKLESNLVNIIFAVRDSQNQPVKDLSKHDVLVTHDGVPQPIAFFARRDELPLVLAIAIDFSGSQQWIWPESRAAVEQFLGHVFRPGHDYVALASFRGTVHLHAALTNQRQRIDRLMPALARTDTGYARQGTALYDAIFVLTDEVLDGPTAWRIARNHHDMIQRALLVLTDGHDTASVHNATNAIARAQRAGVAVYAVGIGDAFGRAGVDHKALDHICRQTGGRAYYPKRVDDLRWAFRQIAEELTTQYMLAFYWPTIRPDDGLIRVQIVGRPNLSIRWRRGYEISSVPL